MMCSFDVEVLSDGAELSQGLRGMLRNLRYPRLYNAASLTLTIRGGSHIVEMGVTSSRLKTPMPPHGSATLRACPSAGSRPRAWPSRFRPGAARPCYASRCERCMKPASCWAPQPATTQTRPSFAMVAPPRSTGALARVRARARTLVTAEAVVERGQRGGERIRARSVHVRPCVHIQRLQAAACPPALASIRARRCTRAAQPRTRRPHTPPPRLRPRAHHAARHAIGCAVDEDRDAWRHHCRRSRAR